MSQTYLLELQKSLEEGAKIRRLGWPEGDCVKLVDTKEITVIEGKPKTPTNIEVKSFGKEVTNPIVEVDGTNLKALAVLGGSENSTLELANGHVKCQSIFNEKGKKTGSKNILGWTPSQEEKMAMDWVIVEEAEEEK